MRHVFRATRHNQLPIVGDLIRSSGAMDYINIVLSISMLTNLIDSNGVSVNFADVRIVRYGQTNGGDFKLLDGQRSRSIRVYSTADGRRLGSWQIVDEYVAVDNTALRCDIVNRMKDIDTAWRNPDGSSNRPSEEAAEDNEVQRGVY